MKFSVTKRKNIETHLKEEGVKKDETLTKNMNQNFPRENLTTSRREKNETSKKKKASFFFFLNTKKRHFRDHCEEPT